MDICYVAQLIPLQLNTNKPTGHLLIDSSLSEDCLLPVRISKKRCTVCSAFNQEVYVHDGVRRCRSPKPMLRHPLSTPVSKQATLCVIMLAGSLEVCDVPWISRNPAIDNDHPVNAVGATQLA